MPNSTIAAIAAIGVMSCLLFTAGPVSQSHAGEIRLGSVVPGAGVVRKSFKSMRERRYTDMVPQKTDFSCGAASVATILKYAYGRETTEVEVLEGMLEISDRELVLKKGFSLLEIKRYVESLGMQGVGFRIAPENMDKIKVPTIALIDIKGYKHFVVLKKVRNQKAYVADPALGNSVMKLDKFAEVWNGVVFAVVADDYDKDNVLLKAKEPLSAKRLYGMRAPVTNANLLDFGFRHADLFRF